MKSPCLLFQIALYWDILNPKHRISDQMLKSIFILDGKYLFDLG